MLVYLKCENADGPTYSVDITMQNFGSVLNSILVRIIQRNGVTCSNELYKGFAINTAAAPTTLGDQALKISTDATTTGFAYYII